jgi:hypothetical protein
MMRWPCIAVLFHASIAAAQLADLGHRLRLTARLSWDLGGETRPVGTLLLVGIAVVAAR